MKKKLIFGLAGLAIVLTGGGFAVASWVKMQLEEKLKQDRSMTYRDIQVSWYATEVHMRQVTLNHAVNIDHLLISDYDWPPTEHTLKQLNQLTITAQGIHSYQQPIEFIKSISKQNRVDSVLTISPAKDPQLQADSLLEITLKADYLTSKIGVHLNNISLSRFLQATQNHPDSLKELFEQVKYKAISTQTQADIVLLRKIAKSMLGQEDDQSIHLLQQDIKHKYRDIKNPQVKQALEQATDHFFNQQETSFTIVAQEALDNEQLIKTFMLFMIASNDAKIINKLLEKFTISNEANL